MIVNCGGTEIHGLSSQADYLQYGFPIALLIPGKIPVMFVSDGLTNSILKWHL
jgi:hypothetical protein